MPAANSSGSKEAVTAALLVIGGKILSGRTKDQNIGYIAEYLTALGIDLKEVRVVDDEETAIVHALNALRHRYSYVFTTGGIGPTHGDITADCVAQAVGVAIDSDPRALVILHAWVKTTGAAMNEARLRLTRIPKGADLILNKVSGAPGFWIGNVIVMAGVPSAAICSSIYSKGPTRMWCCAPTMHISSRRPRAGDVGLGVAAKVVPAVADAQQSDEAAAGTLRSPTVAVRSGMMTSTAPSARRRKSSSIRRCSIDSALLQRPYQHDMREVPDRIDRNRHVRLLEVLIRLDRLRIRDEDQTCIHEAISDDLEVRAGLHSAQDADRVATTDLRRSREYRLGDGFEPANAVDFRLAVAGAESLQHLRRQACVVRAGAGALSRSLDAGADRAPRKVAAAKASHPPFHRGDYRTFGERPRTAGLFSNQLRA